MEEAENVIELNNVTDKEEINKIYVAHQLYPKFTPDGELNTLKYKRFAAIQVTLDEQALKNKEAILQDEVVQASDTERDLYRETMKKKHPKYDLDDGWPIFGGKDSLYKGTIFVPYSEDINFAALSAGEPFKQNLPDNTKDIQIMQYAPKVSEYIAPEITIPQLKDY